MIIKFTRLFPEAKVPARASAGAVGFDAYAYHVVDKNTREKIQDLPVTIPPGESCLIGTGVIFAVPMPVDCQVRPRSGLASKYNIELSNSPGTIDPDYRGEAGILLRNRGGSPFTVEPGMRIAQLVFTKVEIPRFVEVEVLPPSRRNTGGFGSTGLAEISLGDEEYLAEQRKWDRHFMTMAMSASDLSNCLRGAARGEGGRYILDEEGRYRGATRRFGCVIVRNRSVIATGFNTRLGECSEACGCVRERENIPSGEANDRGCLHAEVVAVQNYAKTGGPSLEGTTVYVNAEPCAMCAKLLLGCGIAAVVVPEGVYANNGLAMVLEADIEVRRINVEPKA